MMRFHVSATYQTRSGGMSWADRVFDAPDIAAALAAMQRRIGKRAVRALDMRAVLID